jgi:hypothetical protein
MSQVTDRAATASGPLAVAAAGFLVVGAFLPWRQVIMCVERCGLHAGDWNVLQVGGTGEPGVGGSGPSAYTIAGILVLAGAFLLALAGGTVITRRSRTPRRSYWFTLTVAVGGLAALVGSLTAPVPRCVRISFISSFSTTPGIGKLVCIIGAAFGLCAAGPPVAVALLERRARHAGHHLEAVRLANR